MPWQNNLISFAFATSEGFSTGSGAVLSLRDAMEGKNGKNIVSGVLGGVAGVADFINSWYFQGNVIRDGVHEHSHDGHHHLNQPSEGWTKFWSYLSQTGLIAADFLKVFINRYFLMLTLQDNFGFKLNLPSFWMILGFDLAIKQIFSATNELYESLEGVAQKFALEKPMLDRLIPESFRHQKVVEGLKIIGSIEHAVVDDVIPMLGYFTPEVVNTIRKSLSILIPVAIAGTTLAIPLIVLFTIQTYLFEAQHTQHNFGDEHTGPQISISSGWAKFLKATLMSFMPFAHGAATGMSSFQFFYQLLPKPYNIIIGVVVAVLSAIASGLGNYKSEVKEAMVWLEKMTQKNSNVIYSSSDDSSDDSSCDSETMPILNTKSNKKTKNNNNRRNYGTNQQKNKNNSLNIQNYSDKKDDNTDGITLFKLGNLKHFKAPPVLGNENKLNQVTTQADVKGTQIKSTPKSWILANDDDENVALTPPDNWDPELGISFAKHSSLVINSPRINLAASTKDELVLDMPMLSAS